MIIMSRGSIYSVISFGTEVGEEIGKREIKYNISSCRRDGLHGGLRSGFPWQWIIWLLDKARIKSREGWNTSILCN